MIRRTIFLLMLILFLTISISAQNGVGINSDGTDAHSSALLDVKSSDKGFLPPRMTTTQILAIPSPVAGLMAYNTTLNAIVYFNGTDWQWLSGDPMFYPGQSYGGGVIFYVDGTGHHGLISATSDQSTSAQWGCFGTSVVGASGLDVGTGQSNTTAIVLNGCAPVGSAALICDNLVLNGYSDWFLPSREELNLMYNYKTEIGGFTDNFYWASSENDTYYAWYKRFDDGYFTIHGKDDPQYVRAIRAF